MKNIPEKIYLQVGDLADEEIRETDFNDLSEEDITWCVDKVFPTDIEFACTGSEEENLRKLEDEKWEQRRWELVKTIVHGQMSDPELEATADELAQSSVAVADAVIKLMRGGNEQ